MKVYKVPTKTVISLDHEKMIEDLKAGPVYLDKGDYNTYKALTMYMRHKGLGQLRPARTITYVVKGEEVEVLRVTLIDKPINFHGRGGAIKVRRVSDGFLFNSLVAAVQSTEMPKGARNYMTIIRKVKAGKSVLEASGGVFKEVL